MTIEETTDAPWESLLPLVRGALPLGGTLRRTDPAGACPAAIAVVGLYPALTRTKLYKCADGTRINLPVEVEAHTFEGSESASELDRRYLAPLGLTREQILTIDLYPYYFANTAVGRNGRSMWSNVQTFHSEAGLKTAVDGRPKDDEVVRLCRALPGNADRLAHYFRRCRPALVITLGNEVSAYVRGYEAASQAQAHLYGPPFESDAFGILTSVVHVAHPGLLMRRPTTDPWIARHTAWCATEGKVLVENALRTWSATPAV